MKQLKIQSRRFVIMSALLHMSALHSMTQADAPIRSRAVDLLILTDGTRLLGTLLNPQDDSNYRLLVRTQWLRNEHPEFFEFVTKTENRAKTDPKPVQQLLASHILKLEQATPQDLERIGYLRERLKKLHPEEAGRAVPETVIIEIAGELVRRQLLQKPAARHIAMLAFRNRIADIESQSVADLKAELTKLAADTELLTEPPDASATSSEQQFLRILINTEYLFGKRCRLILHGGQYFDADNQNADLSRILPGLLQAELQNQLQQLLSEPAFAGVKPANGPGAVAGGGTVLDAAATALATDKQADLVEVTRMQIDAQQATARVNISVFFKTAPSAEWTKVHHVTAPASAADVPADQGQQLANDPRVRQVTQLFQALGVGGNQLATAVSVGAVVQTAQNAAQQQLTDWLSNSSAAVTSGIQIATIPVTKLP